MADKPIINSFSALAPLVVQQYERYLPTAFDESMTLLEKVNKVIQYCNSVGTVTNGVVDQWNQVMAWVEADGLTSTVEAKIDAMFADGTLSTDIVEGINNIGTRLDGMDSSISTINSTLSTTQTTANGAMQKSVYDADGDGKVDTTQDAEKLGGQLPSYYASQSAVDKKEDKIYDLIPKIPSNVFFNDNVNNIVIDWVFDLAAADSGNNFQSVGYHNGYIYCGYDMNGGNGKIVQYDMTGTKLKETGLLPLGHTASIVYRQSNGHLYVANGSATAATHIYEVDFAASTPTIISDMDFSGLGNSGLATIDNDADHLVIHAADNDTAPHKFYITDFNKNIISQFTIPNQGVPQGLGVYAGFIYFYIDNNIVVLDMQGNIQTRIPVAKGGENQGLAIAGDYGTPYILIGASYPQRLYAIRPYANEQFHTMKLFNLPTQHDFVNNPAAGNNVTLLPRMLSIPFRHNEDGTWTVAPWGNGVTDGNLINTITDDGTQITISLKRKIFTSMMYFGCHGGTWFQQNGVLIDFAVDSDGQTMHFNFYDRTGTHIAPSTVGTANIRTLVVGGVRHDV